MKYLENASWQEYYQEIDEEKRWQIYERLVKEIQDDGANALRKELYQWRYINPKKPGKRVDKGIWEMIVMPAQLRGVIVFSGSTKKQIAQSLKNLRITEENSRDEVLRAAVYWEIRNIARRFYDSCNSPKYGRKFFGLQQSDWDEKLRRMSKDLWNMAENVPNKFHMEKEMEIFSDAVLDEFFAISQDARDAYGEIKAKYTGKRFPIVL